MLVFQNLCDVKSIIDHIVSNYYPDTPLECLTKEMLFNVLEENCNLSSKTDTRQHQDETLTDMLLEGVPDNRIYDISPLEKSFIKVRVGHIAVDFPLITLRYYDDNSNNPK